MILSAQRVRYDDGAMAIHCYHFAQDPSFVPESPMDYLVHEGDLVWSHRDRPEEARVISFLDILAPEGVSASELADATAALTALESPPSAFAASDQRVGFSLGLEADLRPVWKEEVLALTAYLFEHHP